MSGIQRINKFFNECFLHVGIKSKDTDEGEKLEKFPVFFRCTFEGLFGDGIFFFHILLKLLKLTLFQAENLFIDLFHAEIFVIFKIFFRQRF